MDSDGTNQLRLTNNVNDTDRSPSFNFDGTKIVYKTDPAGNDEIYIMDIDGTNKTNLTNHTDNDVQPAFSPDGTKIAFRTNRDGGAPEVYIMNVDGTNQTNLSNNAADDRSPIFER